MMRLHFVVVLCTTVFLNFGLRSANAGLADEDIVLRRGDSNDDGTVDVSDVSHIGNWLFNGGPTPPCLNNADVNDDGAVDISDQTYLSNFLFQGGPQPPWPGPYTAGCYTDTTTPNISCDSAYCP